MSNVIKNLDELDKEIGLLLTMHFAKFSAKNSEMDLTIALINAIQDFRSLYDQKLKYELGKEATHGK